MFRRPHALQLKNKTRIPFLIQLLTLTWLTATIFAYPESFYVDYIEPNQQQLTESKGFNPTQWNTFDVFTETSIESEDLFWHIANNLSLHVVNAKETAFQITKWPKHSYLNQSINLISFQYFQSALPA